MTDKKMRLTRREMLALQNKGVVKQTLDGSLEHTGLPDVKAVPLPPTDNKKKSWRVHDFERDFDGWIEAVTISEI